MSHSNSEFEGTEHPNNMESFQLENRYVVIKLSQLSPQQQDRLAEALDTNLIETVDCVVVEKHWPIYSHVLSLVKQLAFSACRQPSMPRSEATTAPIKQSGLSVGWRGWYTRRGGERWYECTVMCFDNGAPVIKTNKGHYHKRPTSEFEFVASRPIHC